MEEARAQFHKLHTGCSLASKLVITTRSVFEHCLEGFSPNGNRPRDNVEVARSVGALPDSAT